MNVHYKGKAKYSLAGLPLLLFVTLTFFICNVVNAQNNPTLSTDTFSIKRIKKDTVIVPKVDTLPYKVAKDNLDAPVKYHAEDSMVLDVPAKKILLYGKETKVNYVDNELISPRIEFDQRTSLVSAYLVKDSNGNVVSMPVFNQAEFSSVADSIRFNMKNGKGITKGTYTKQGEMYIYGEKLKKVSPDVFYALKTRFTTCNLDTPHFAFVSKKVKFINKKMAFTGPVHPEFEGVPVPVVLPFGIYPLRQGRHSGLIAPTFTANAELGLALEGIGYYRVINDNWDVVTRGTLYSYGGWTANISPRYYKRYRYQGNLTFDIQHFKDLDNAGARGFNLRWTHSADTKSRPGVTFSANVDAGSSRFNQAVPNSPQRRFNNNFGSSITYAKVWKDKPYNLTVAANHRQNINLKFIQINLPDVGFNVNTQYPFRRKEKIGEDKWYENIGIALNTSAKSLSSFYDTAGNIAKQFINKLQWGAQHTVPITLSLPAIGPFQFSPQVSYAEKWYQQQLFRSWNSTTKKVDSVINKGFYTAREMSFGMGMTTRIFGMIGFKKGSKIQAIRHEIRPSISANYKPDMNRRSWQRVQVDTTGKNFTDVSIYDGSIYQGFGQGKFGGLSFGIDNIVQMKVRNKKDTAEGGLKKVTLIDGFSINGGYNFLQDSFKLTALSLSFRTNLFDKIAINASASSMPYQTNANGEFIDKLIWAKKPWSLGTLTGGNISVSSSFQGGDKKEQPNAAQQQQITNPISGMPLDEYQQEAAYLTNNPGQFANFNIPWSVNFAYSLQFNRTRNTNLIGYRTDVTQNISGGGSLNLTPKWQMGLNGSYDITTKELGLITMYLTREMHCWQMSINLSTSRGNNYFNISISPKSGLLRDLKINRTRYFYDL
ncbi:MAG: LPS-assembly protein LptD [Ferruginibacter sp.]|nr:LPS-assembly protein LptD [Ferruginibacter sp.]